MSGHSYTEGLEAMGHKAHSDGIGYSAIYSWYGQTMDRLQSDDSNVSEEFRSLTAKVETWKHFWPDEPFFAEQDSSQETPTTLLPTAGSSKQPITPNLSRSPIKTQQASHGNMKRDHKRYHDAICANCNMRGHILSHCVAPVDEFGFISGCPRCNTKKHLYDECSALPKSTGRGDWAYLILKRMNCPPIRSSKDIRNFLKVKSGRQHPWTYDFSLKQVGKFEVSYDDYGIPKGLYPDPAWETPDKVLSQAYPRTMDTILPRLWYFHWRLNRKSADLGYKFEVFLKSMSEAASDSEIITSEIVRLAEALECISEFESKKARGEWLTIRMRKDIKTKQAKELEFEAKLNAYHAPENYRPRNHDSSPDNERTVPSAEEKGKGKAIDVHSPSSSHSYAEEEQSMYQNYTQRYAPDNPFNEGTSSNVPSESTPTSENLVVRKEFGSNLTPAVENYKRRDLSSPEKVLDCVPVNIDTQSSGQSEQGENQLSKFAEFKYEQSKEQKQLEKRISNLRRDLKEINSFEKRVEMLTTNQCNQLKMKELKERELRVLLEIRGRYVISPEPISGSKINTSERRQSFGAPGNQAPNLEYPANRHDSSSGGSSNSSGKSSTSEELPPEGLQTLTTPSFPSIRKSPLSYVQTAPSVGVQDSNDNNNSTGPEESQSYLVVTQDTYPALNRRQKAKGISHKELNRSSSDARTIAPAAKTMTIIARPQSLRRESVADSRSKLSSSHTQVATSDSGNNKKQMVISDSTESQHLQSTNEVKNQTGLISGPMESRNSPKTIDNSQNLPSASNEKQFGHVANKNMELASREVQTVSKVDDIHQDATKLKENHLQQSRPPYVPPFKAKQMLASEEKLPLTLPQGNSESSSSIYKPPHKREKQSLRDNGHQSSLLEEDTANHGKSATPVHILPQMRITQPTSKTESPPSVTQSPIQIIEPEQSSSTNGSISQNQQLLDSEVAYPKKSNKKSSTPTDQSYLEADDEDSSSMPQFQTSPRSSNLQQKSPRTMRRSERQCTSSSGAYLPEPEDPLLTTRLQETVSNPSNSWPELLDPDSFADSLDCEWPNDKIDLSVPLRDPDVFLLDNEDCNTKEPLRSPIALPDPDTFLIDNEDCNTEESLKSSIPLPDPDILLLDEEDCNNKKSLRSSIPTILHSRSHRQSNHASSTISGGNSKIQEADKAVSDENASKICFTCDKVGHHTIDCPSSWRLDALVLDNFPYSSSRYRAGLGNSMQANKANEPDLNLGANNSTPTWSRSGYPDYTSLPGNFPHPNLPHIADAGNQLHAKPKSDLDPPTDFFYPSRLTKGDHLVEGLPGNWIEIAEKISSFFHADWDQEVNKLIETRYWEVQKVMRNTGDNFSLGNNSDDEGSGEEKSEDDEIILRYPWQTKSSDCTLRKETRERKKRLPAPTKATADKMGHDYNMEERKRNMLTKGSPRNPHAFQPRRITNGAGFFYPVPGDWFCISRGCGERNISESIICKKCSSPRGTRRVDGSIEIFQPGDWVAAVVLKRRQFLFYGIVAHLIVARQMITAWYVVENVVILVLSFTTRRLEQQSMFSMPVIGIAVHQDVQPIILPGISAVGNAAVRIPLSSLLVKLVKLRLAIFLPGLEL
ncbi:uncharacterized protein EAF02_006992 [Botrytis sinoallii]|uniref:uncharacterized protein n=1 Tax=Botrytis sinoallii TaxID=1463999 RepID=UPI001901E4D5|nr:uncharacterized protein EAF02_006992 [Botrytis sinoallii]KAF7881101.1 hypothetical protein EAF02_006992 [Botrytis sinoallii]